LNYAYYVNDDPLCGRGIRPIVRRTVRIEAAHPDLITPVSPTQRVGGVAATQFGTVLHSVPMLSLNNGFSDADVEAFDRRVAELLGVAAADSSRAS